MFNENNICVAYASDDNYSAFMGISMLSLFESNKSAEGITVFILDYGISGENVKKLEDIAEKYQRKLIFCAVDDYISTLDLNMGPRKISIVSYARLFLASIIPADYDRVIYLDCDTIINGDMLPMWRAPIGDSIVAGVQDTVDRFFLNAVGLPDGTRYVNAGILLLNLKIWREENLQSKFMDYIREKNGNVPHHDQGVINHVSGSRRLILPLRFNVTANIFSFSEKVIRRMHDIKGEYYSQSDIDEARESPVVLHFTAGLLGRPWQEGCRHPKQELYKAALALSPWSDKKLEPNNEKLSVKISAFVCEHISARLFAEIYRLMNFVLHRM